MNDTLKGAARDYSQELFRAFHLFSNRQKALFLGLLFLFVVGVAGIIYKVNLAISVEVPAYAGTLREGEVGVPRFINPALAISDVDHDLTMLIYSGLMRTDEHGSLIHDLALSHTVSADDLTYTFTLRKGLLWHDGEPITSSDIAYTIKRILDPTTKSPVRPGWEGVTVETPDDLHIVFTLKHAYGPFLDNTTLGILPKHIWEKIDADSFAFTTKNSEPVGSGPYLIEKVTKNSSGIPEQYTLRAFKGFALGEPYITHLELSFYPNEDALATAYERGQVEAISTLAPLTAERIVESGGTVRASALPLPRVFAAFFNQNSAHIFTDKTVRQALTLAIDKQSIVNTVFHGYATTTDSPLPPNSLSTPHEKVPSSMSEAKSLLEKDGWTKGVGGIYEKTTSTKTKKETTRLSFAVSTANTPELKDTTEELARMWRTLGADVTIHYFEIGDLNQNVIRPRKYDVLVFGESLGSDPDPFAFWHSSQRNDPGLNVAQYASTKVDDLLEKARATADPDERRDYFGEFEKEVIADIPAVFLYAPSFIYATPSKLQGMSLVSVNTPADRFANIGHWFLETDRVWKWFAPK